MIRRPIAQSGDAERSVSSPGRCVTLLDIADLQPT
jgi:hypothetical protein